MKKSKSMALGGVVSAVSLVLMFFSGFMPFLAVSLPAFAGAVLIMLVIELGFKWAIVAYVAVSLLSISVLPNKEPAILFILLFGYYPALKSKIESKIPKLGGYLIKFLIFNIAALASYYLIVLITGVNYLDEYEKYGIFAAIGLLVTGNIAFVLYDILLTRGVLWYIYRFKPKYLK